jgi:uncharacterized membrane protein
MRRVGVFVVALVGGCGSPETGSNGPQPDAAEPAPNAVAPAPEPGVEPIAGWDLQSSGEGTALALLSGSGAASIRLFCPSGAKRLLVNVADFKPVGSEERMTFGSRGEAATLVADPRGDAQRGGVSGTGDVPADLPALIAGPISVNYGAQNSGPHPAAPARLSRAFVAACQEGTKSTAPSAEASAAPCLMQGDQRLSVTPLRAIGTEPFWGARVEGRCVTYSRPEDQKGTRVWTRYTPGANGSGSWSGSLGGSRFELRIRREAGCSDGMSDTRYPFAVELLVNGEQRRGCAAPV